MKFYKILSSIFFIAYITNIYANSLDIKTPSKDIAAQSYSSSIAYAKRFEQYIIWHKQLPITPSDEFIQFISGDKPLSVKLRNKWLYELARQKNWDLYNKYYKPSKDITLQCYQNVALLEHGHLATVMVNAKKLWLKPVAQPKACDQVFRVLLSENIKAKSLILSRMKLAISHANVRLAYYLMRQFLHNKANNVVLNKLQQRILIDPDKTLKPYNARGVQKNLYKYLKENFYIQVFLDKAKHHSKNALYWFNKIDKTFYTQDLLAWKIRSAMRNYNWDVVINTIEQLPHKNLPEWRYWLARAKDAKGQHKEAVDIYNSLLKNRDYYGFLSAYRLKKPYSFHNVQTNVNSKILTPYNNIMQNIAKLYNNKDITQASLMADDFFSELPFIQKIAFCEWLSNKLQWYGKSVDLSRDKALTNELFLRFPVVYYNLIQKYSKKYTLPDALVYAIIRQESAFRQRVQSFAGAQGLMQLMPATAAFIAQKANIPYKNSMQLLQQDKNINLGTAYLKLLSYKFSNNLILMAAAYNAGPTQVNRWLRMSNNLPLDIWIELVPWQETRNYLKNIIMFYAIYQFRLKQRPDISIFFKNVL